MTDKELFSAIRAMGLSIRKQDGEYRINFANGREASAYYTDDKTDTLNTARVMYQNSLEDYFDR